MLIYVNNKRVMRISQERADGEIAVATAERYRSASPSDTLLIPPGDFVMLVNLYKHNWYSRTEDISTMQTCTNSIGLITQGSTAGSH